MHPSKSPKELVKILITSRSSIGEIIDEEDVDECDDLQHMSRKSRYNRHLSTSVEKLRSAQSSAIELFNNTLPLKMQIKTVGEDSKKRYLTKKASPSNSPTRNLS